MSVTVGTWALHLDYAIWVSDLESNTLLKSNGSSWRPRSHCWSRPRAHRIWLNWHFLPNLIKYLQRKNTRSLPSAKIPIYLHHSQLYLVDINWLRSIWVQQRWVLGLRAYPRFWFRKKQVNLLNLLNLRVPNFKSNTPHLFLLIKRQSQPIESLKRIKIMKLVKMQAHLCDQYSIKA